MKTIQQYEAEKQVRLIPKTQSLLMRLTAFILGSGFMNNFWTTYRLPFQKVPTITYPPDVLDPLKYFYTLEHEMVHVEDLRKPFAPIYMGLMVSLLPLPILFSGRWYVERYAYLHNILNHGYSVDYVVETLWSKYAWCWPRSLMRKWFLKKIAERSKKNEDNTGTSK